jgi:uncharacterized protein (TIGR03382 family)
MLLASINTDTNYRVIFAVNGSPVIFSGSRGVPFGSKGNTSGDPLPTLQLTVQAVTPIPVPPALVLMLSGLGVLLARRNKTRTS